jgi:hypothetical protein
VELFFIFTDKSVYMKKLILFYFVSLAFQTEAQISGCPDPLALNFSMQATQNDGSCVYSAESVIPENSNALPELFSETSGLILWNERLWTHNDDTDTNIYALNPGNQGTFENYPVLNSINIDWEEISQDADYLYIGDFGNNANGNRKDLQIYKIKKSTLLTNNQEIENIQFSYSAQTDFTATGSNNTDFDCEAFVVTADKIFLFTKEWLSKKTSVYSLPKSPGKHVAAYQNTYDVNGLITGVTYLESKNLLVFCGYSSQLMPFLYLLYDFKGENFFGGNKRKLTLDLPFHQTEGIASSDGLNYFLSNEAYQNISQKIHKIDLSNYLENYLSTLSLGEFGSFEEEIVLFPNPVADGLTIKLPRNYESGKFVLYDLAGKILMEGALRRSENKIYVGALNNGIYILVIQDDKNIIKKIIKV